MLFRSIDLSVPRPDPTEGGDRTATSESAGEGDAEGRGVGGSRRAEDEDRA